MPAASAIAPGGGLVAHRLDRLRRRPDEREPGLRDRLREVRPLRRGTRSPGGSSWPGPSARPRGSARSTGTTPRRAPARCGRTRRPSPRAARRGRRRSRRRRSGCPSSRHVRMMRTAISPRFAIRTFGFLASPRHSRIRPSTSDQGAGRADRSDDLEQALAAAGLRPPCVGGGYRFDERDGGALATDGAPEWTLVSPRAIRRRDAAASAAPGRTSRTGAAVLVRARPRLPPERAGLLTLLAGAAWAETAREVAGVDATASGRTTCWWTTRRWAACWPRAGGRGAARRRDPRLRRSTSSRRSRRPGRRPRRRRGSGRPAHGVPRAVPRGATRSAAPRVGRVRARWRAVAATLGRDVEAARTDGSRSAGAPWTSTTSAASCSTRVTGSRSWPSARSSI